VLVSHDRHLLDRVSTQVLALDGRGGAHAFADYDQWEANRPPPLPPEKDAPRPSTAKAPPSGARRLSYLEQREWSGMEAAVLEAEARVAEARARAEDPSIATDADMLQKRLAELADLQAQVDRLYARWAALDEKQK
jgi:ATP-binding cassette subfamily F protein uup